jgi:hypothetical protein
MTAKLFGLLAFSVAMSAAAHAAPLVVTSYSGPNGNGQASGGSFNYWDLAYNGIGATNVDGAPLTGGTGDLTDGVVASDFWFNVENVAGTGPYVGWYNQRTPNPTILFNFAGAPTVNQIDIHLDNSFVGGVFAPSAIWVDGVAQAFTAPSPGTIGTVSLTGLSLVGPSHSIQFFQANGGWVFVSEISFFGAAGVPEPASWALMIVGFGLAGGAVRRRSLRPALT